MQRVLISVRDKSHPTHREDCHPTCTICEDVITAFAVTGSVACVACYLIAGLLLRVPKLASIL